MKSHVKDQVHQFACYLPGLASYLAAKSLGNNFTITDAELVHRLVTVLRVKKGNSIRLFDQTVICVGSIVSAQKKKSVVVAIEQIDQVQFVQPHITVLLPLLKRDALQAALYSCVELGASEVQLVISEKVHQGQLKQISSERIQSVCIAAAEQSKNFSFPIVHDPVPLSDALIKYGDYDCALFFHPDGRSCDTVMCELQSKKNFLKKVVMLVGPEGGMTQAEEVIIRDAGFIFCRLTPTVLRALQAVAVGLGLLRSFLLRHMTS